MESVLQHHKQKKQNSCGAACYSFIVGIDEKTARKECKTDCRGTYIENVSKALTVRGIENYIIYLNIDYIEYQKWLEYNSSGRFLYLSCDFISNSGRGRNSIRRHVVVAFDGKIYDPGEKSFLPIESVHHLYNRNLKIKAMILIDKDQEFFRKKD